MSEQQREPRREVSAGGDAASGAREETTAGESRPRPEEVGGPPGPEPTRYGDWERKGRCIDF